MENGEDLRVVQVAAGEAHTLALTGTLAFFSLSILSRKLLLHEDW